MAIISAIGSLAGVALQGHYQDKLLGQQNQFNASEAEAARLFASEPERYKRLVGLGFNPDLTAASIMGQGAASTPFAASSAALGAAPDFSQLGNLLGGLPSQLLQQKLQEAQIDNLNSNTKYQDIMNGYAPLSQEAQINFLNSQSAKLVEAGKLDKEMAAFYNEQTKWIPILSAAEASQRYADVMETFVKIDEMWSQIDVNEALAGKYDADAAVSWQQVKESVQRTENLKKEGLILDNRVEQSSYERDESWASSVQAIFDANYRGLMNGMPMSGDAMKDLIFMRATPEGREFSNKFIEQYFDGARELFDFDMENRMNHFWDNFFLGVTGSDVLSAGSNIAGSTIMARGMAGRSAVKGVKGAAVPAGLQTGSNVGKTGIKPLDRLPIQSKGKTYKYVRTDSYGNDYFRSDAGDYIVR